MKKIISIVICTMIVISITSCASHSSGFDYKKHHSMNKKLQKRGYQRCGRH